MVQQPRRRFRQSFDPTPIVVLRTPGDVSRGGNLVAACEFHRAHPARQLQQRERIAARLGDDPVTDASVDPARGRTPEGA
jgi:hypothetical protein